MKPSSYIIPTPPNEFPGKCPVMFTINSYDIWILGDAFLRGYYAMFDHGSLQFSISPSKNSGTTLVLGGAPAVGYD